MISRYQLVCGAILFGLALLYQAMAQVDGYRPGVDYPIYNSVPFGLGFTCQGKLPGYYADPETRCQAWHWCLPNGRMYSFLCPNGTVFSQTVRVCDWWFKVDCQDSPRLYGINDDLYRDARDQAIFNNVTDGVPAMPTLYLAPPEATKSLPYFIEYRLERAET